MQSKCRLSYEEVFESEVKTDTLKYYSINGIRIAQFSSVSGLHYVHSDQLGSAVRLSDGTGALVNITAYAPFEITMEPIPENLDLTTPLVDTIEHYKARNTIRISASVEGISDIFSEAGETIKLLPGFKVQRGAKFRANINEVLKTVINLGSVKPRYKFTGKELDSSGLYYFGARFYDPSLGRFISADTYLDGLNRYAYCGNNPVRFVDPTGHFWLELGLILLGAYIGGVAANNWQWNPLQWNWGNYQTYLGMAIGGLAGAGAGYIIGGLFTPGATGSGTDTNEGVRTNPYNTSVPDWMNTEVDGGDLSCEELLKEIIRARNKLRQRYDEMREDKNDLFNTKLTGENSWEGHQEQFRSWQKHLQDLLDEFNTRGCGSGLIPVDAWDLATREAPVQPAPKQIPQPQPDPYSVFE